MCYISAHKRQAEDKDSKGRTETKQNTTKRLYVCDNYVYIATGFVFSCKKSSKSVIHNLSKVAKYM